MADACCGGSDSSPDLDGGQPDAPLSFWALQEVRSAAVAGLAVAVGLVAGSRDADSISIAAFVVALVAGGSTFVPETLRNLTRGRLGVGTLMTVAGCGAVLLGELGEAASLAFLFSISEALEGYALTKTRRGLRALLSLVPELVTVRRLDGLVDVPPGELVVGDVMVVRPGDRLATDGIVVAGRSVMDLSAITGESVPVEVSETTTVFAAAINGNGVLDVQVTARTTDSSLARVVQIVEEAQERKGVSQRLAERIARPLVPGVMVLAALIALVGSALGDPSVWVERALVVLVAAAPCAFAISVPVTVVAAVGAATRMGALIKGGAALEALCGIDVVALDKTGTLTRNEPVVVAVVPVAGRTEADVLAVAGGLEAHSQHPLAAPILGAAVAVAEATDVQAVPGHGITGVIDGTPVRLGKPGFIDGALLIGDIERLQTEGATVVLVEADGDLLGAVAVRDELRPEAPSVVRDLGSLGIGQTVMLTGDNRRTANAIATTAGISAVHAELLPEDKAQLVSELKAQGRVAMVGDGINDAPALATADVGLAMGAMGSDVAIEAADVALMGQRLDHLPETLAHAQRAKRIMVQNLVMSGLIITALVPLAGFGALGLATVVASHEIAELFVIGNGLRAARTSKRFRSTTPVSHAP